MTREEEIKKVHAKWEPKIEAAKKAFYAVHDKRVGLSMKARDIVDANNETPPVKGDEDFAKYTALRKEIGKLQVEQDKKEETWEKLKDQLNDEVETVQAKYRGAAKKSESLSEQVLSKFGEESKKIKRPNDAAQAKERLLKLKGELSELTSELAKVKSLPGDQSGKIEYLQDRIEAKKTKIATLGDMIRTEKSKNESDNGKRSPEEIAKIKAARAKISDEIAKEKEAHHEIIAKHMDKLRDLYDQEKDAEKKGDKAKLQQLKNRIEKMQDERESLDNKHEMKIKALDNKKDHAGTGWKR